MHMVHTGRCLPYLKDVLLPVSSSFGRAGLRSATTAQYVKPKLRTVSVNVLFLSLDLSHGMTYLVSYILLLLLTLLNGSLRPIFLICSLSFQLNFILVYYKVTVLLRRWTFDCNWHTTSFHCIVLYIRKPRWQRSI